MIMIIMKLKTSVPGINCIRFPILTQSGLFHLLSFPACKMIWIVHFTRRTSTFLIILKETSSNLLEAQAKGVLQT